MNPDYRLKHIAFIMDGNGRWAKSKGMRREYGHINGAKTLFDTAANVFKYGIPYLTVYAFSTENWMRPEDEVGAIKKLLIEYITKAFDIMKKDNVSFRFIGDVSRFGDKVVSMADKLTAESASNKWVMNVAINYGGRAEIVRAANLAIASGKKILTEEDIEQNLYSSCPPPDLIVRTGGEMRLSNFLLWQSAYAEYYSTQTLWPDFDKNELDKALEAFSSRKRRFGGLIEK